MSDYKIGSPERVVKRVNNKPIEAIVTLDEDGNYKARVEYKSGDNPDLLYLPFTTESFELKDRLTIFTRKKVDNRYVRNIRDASRAKFFPGNSDVFVPFAPNFVVEGYLVRVNGELQFDFDKLIKHNEYENAVINAYNR